MLKIHRKDYEALRQHGEETYPHECCGVLLGQMDDDGVRTVTSIARAGNTRTDSAAQPLQHRSQGTDPHPARRARARRGHHRLLSLPSRPSRPVVADRSGGGALVRLLLRDHQRGEGQGRADQFVRADRQRRERQEAGGREDRGSVMHVWGGHSCPPPLTLVTDGSGSADPGNTTVKVKSGGRECPPHTALLNPAALLWHHV